MEFRADATAKSGDRTIEAFFYSAKKTEPHHARAWDITLAAVLAQDQAIEVYTERYHLKTRLQRYENDTDHMCRFVYTLSTKSNPQAS